MRSHHGKSSSIDIVARIQQARETGIETDTADSILEDERPHNDVLTEMNNFLADEDIHRKLYFGDRLKTIIEYVEGLKAEDDFDLDLMIEVKDKCDLHEDWVQKETKEKAVSFEIPKAAPESSRLLPLEVPLTRAISKSRPKEKPFGDDHQPFTIKRPGNHSEFVRALQADADVDTRDPNYNNATNLAAIEERAYRGTVSNADNLQRHEDEEDTSFPAMAAKRGIRRAAIEKGLQILASNDEQDFDERGRWDILIHPHAIKLDMVAEVPLSEPFVGYEVRITDPYEYTRKVRAYREGVMAEARQWRNEEIHNHNGDSFYFPSPVNFRGPYLPVKPDVAREGNWKRQSRLFRVVRNLKETEQRASRQLIRRVLAFVMEGIADQRPFDAEFEPISDAQIERLLVLTQPSRRANREAPAAQGHVPTEAEQQQADRLDLLASYITPILSSALFPLQTTRLTLQDVLQNIDASIDLVNTQPFTEGEMDVLLPILGQRGLIS